MAQADGQFIGCAPASAWTHVGGVRDIRSHAAGKPEDAADELLEIIRRDREWNDEGARKQLVKFFEAWGPKDPLTLQARRRLSSMLFS